MVSYFFLYSNRRSVSLLLAQHVLFTLTLCDIPVGLQIKNFWNNRVQQQQ